MTKTLLYMSYFMYCSLCSYYIILVAVPSTFRSRSGSWESLGAAGHGMARYGMVWHGEVEMKDGIFFSLPTLPTYLPFFLRLPT